tara:strand:+ start:1362 stop:2648 length:1287 start_codon:yes stop_codon:yes gene_type:complete
MNRNLEKYSIFDSRPIILIANSSWYLYHYRNLLINKISKKNKIITIAPFDQSSRELSKISIFIPWNIRRKNDSNLISFIISFIKLMFLIKALKPKLIHSHTLKTNLITSIVTAIYGIPCVLSFAGMGRLSKEKRFKFIFFKKLIKLISYYSMRKRETRWSMNIVPNRSTLIFQNPIDMNFFEEVVPDFHKESITLIPGSGLPQKYLLDKKVQNNWSKKEIDKTLTMNSITLIYCGRLIKSKGIYKFIEILKLVPNVKGIIYGSIDPSSADSLSTSDINEIAKKNKNITFFGNKIDPFLNLINDYPIFIMPSEYGEGVSRSIVESLSRRIPVISSQTALSGIFSDSNLYICKNNTPEEYYDLILRIIADYKSYKLIKKLKIGYKYISDNLTEESVVKKTISAYSFLLDKNDSSYLINRKNSNNLFWLAQ